MRKKEKLPSMPATKKALCQKKKHRMNAANTYEHPTKGKLCRACLRDYQRDFMAKWRAKKKRAERAAERKKAAAKGKPAAKRSARPVARPKARKRPVARKK
ncbi:MAG: hypothetical protein ACSLFQ_02865 [Thermoanaerobaculia bacterium]